MTGPIIRTILGAALVLVVGGCEREEREFRPPPPQASWGGRLEQIRMSELQAGATTPQQPPANPAENHAYDLSEGKRLFAWFNCNGCHGNGGGDIGPALMDDRWIYGSEAENVVASIMQGRPNGMPSFAGKISPQQVWQVAGYVRSMSGLTPKQASPGRKDGMAAKTPEQSVERQPPRGSDLPPSTQRPQ